MIKNGAKNFCLEGQGKTILLICDSRKMQTTSYYIHTYMGKICQTVQFQKYFRRMACVQSYLVSLTLFESRVQQNRLPNKY